MSVKRLLLFLLIQSFNIPSFSEKVSRVYIDNGHDQTVLHEVPSDNFRIELEEEMLNIFDIREKPDFKQRLPDIVNKSAPMFLIDVYKIFHESENEVKKRITSNIENLNSFQLTDQNLRFIKESNLIISLSAQSHKAPDVKKISKVKRLWFNVSDVLPEDEIINAELRLYRSVHNVQNKVNKGPITVSVYRITTSRDEDGNRGKILVDSVNSTEKDGWVNLNITESLHHWVHTSDVNRGLFIKVHAHERSHKEIKPEEFGFVGFRDDPEKRPFMVGYFKRTRQRRPNKINSSIWEFDDPLEDIYRPQRSVGGCMKRNLYFNFEDLNWQNWIIEPKGYEANFCHGDCDFLLNSQLAATKHALIQSLIHLKDPSKAPSPSCAPSKLATISVIYSTDDENYIMSNRVDMKVESCACH